MNGAPAIVILNQGSLPTAQRLQAVCPGATVYGLEGRVAGADVAYTEFGATVRDLFLRDVPVVCLCAAGIVIRTLASQLSNKRAEPPVLAVAEDGSAVVPLLGGLRGVNALARTLAAALEVAPAITTSGELRFNLALETPPPGYVLRNPDDGKRFMSDLLAGASVRVEGEAPWLAQTRIVPDPAGTLVLRITPEEREPGPGELLYHPRSVVVAVSAVLKGGEASLADRAEAALAAAGLSRHAVAWVLAAEAEAASPAVHTVAALLGAPLRLVAGEAAASPAALVRAAVPEPIADVRVAEDGAVALAVAAGPERVAAPGRLRGRVAVVGLGPGRDDLRTPAVREELRHAQDIIGYETYVRMAGPFRPDQTVHGSDNRVEMDRARHAFSLAAQGRRVVVVSSGDPGVFAMASAVVEALHLSRETAWHGVDLAILPGISAAQAAAAVAGAPLGHDFCVLSLSDNLKPLPVILERLEHAAAADLVMAFYNPLSVARPWQLEKALETVRRHRGPETPVVLGRDIGRPAEALTVVSLGALTPAMVDMRTVVIVGSSHTRTFPRVSGGAWVYAPRWYEVG